MGRGGAGTTESDPANAEFEGKALQMTTVDDHGILPRGLDRAREIQEMKEAHAESLRRQYEGREAFGGAWRDEDSDDSRDSESD